MRLNFYHDTKVIYSKENNEYYNSGFNYSIWKRYLKVFDELTVHTRVIENSKYNPVENETISSGENVDFKPIKSYQGKNSILNLKSVICEIEHSIQNERYFILRIPSIIGVITGLLLIKNKKSYMVEVVGYSKDVSRYRGGIIPKLIGLPNNYLQKKVVRNASVVTYITEEYLSRKYKNNKKTFKSVPNIHYDKSKDSFNKIKKHEVGLSDRPDTYHIGLIGSLDINYKGHKTAFKAIKAIKNRGYNVKLHLVGPGNLNRWRKIIDNLDIENEVNHKGKIPSGKMIDEFLRSLDFYIQPSKTEGHGRALIEAVNNSCVCFGSRVGGIPETLDSDYTFNKNDYKTLAKLIIEHIESKDKQIENIKINYERIKKYDPKIVEDRRFDALSFYKNIGGQ